MSGLNVGIYRVAQMPDPKPAIEERYIALIAGPSTQKYWFSSDTLFDLRDQMERNSVVIADWRDVENKIVTEGVFRLER